ncbi:MAG: DUF5937 family protein [Thermaerobacter sp.]|nr:DUF5937 family protein [Thermaerobacter sp.]
MIIHVKTALRAPSAKPTARDFYLSPLREVCWALHVFSRPTDHGVFLRWALDVRQRLGTSLTERIDEMAPFFLGWLQAMIPLPNPQQLRPPFIAEWERFMGLNPDHLRAVYQHSGHRWTQEFDLRMARNSEWENVTLLTQPEWWRQWEHNLGAVRDRLGWLLREFWTQEFEQVWQAVAADLANDIAGRTAPAETADAPSWWQAISPRLRLDRDTDALQVHVPWNSEFVITPTTVVEFFPSVFCWPHLWVEGWQNRLSVTYQSQAVRRWAAPVPAPARLESRLEALSEPTRLLIIRHLVGAQGTTGAIAHALRLSAGTVSRHLRRLHAVGLVERIAQGHYVLYRANLPALEELAGDLQTLQRDAVPAFLRWD